MALAHNFSSFTSAALTQPKRSASKIDQITIWGVLHKPYVGWDISSAGTPCQYPQSNKFFKQIPYDVLAIRKHMNFGQHYKGRYLSSNINITVFDAHNNSVSVPVGTSTRVTDPHYRQVPPVQDMQIKMKTARRNRSVTVFGVLFNFAGSDVNKMVQRVEDMILEPWFIDTITDEPDVFLWVGHMSVACDRWPIVFNAIWDVHPMTPILIFGGHLHVRDCPSGRWKGKGREGRHTDECGEEDVRHAARFAVQDPYPAKYVKRRESGRRTMMKEQQLQNAGRVNIQDFRYIPEWSEKTYVCNSSARGEEKWACDVTGGEGDVQENGEHRRCVQKRVSTYDAPNSGGSGTDGTGRTSEVIREPRIGDNDLERDRDRRGLGNGVRPRPCARREGEGGEGHLLSLCLWRLGFARVGVGGRAGGKHGNEREGKGKARERKGRRDERRKGGEGEEREQQSCMGALYPAAFSGRARSGTREMKCKSSPIIGGSVGEHVASTDRAAVAARHSSGRMDHGTGHA
ncbi:hypothetical protein B0H14DRAFT_2566861 [Mycena olivaceomarginata]|nr:hypothetical protein B0H14DRAFT_2566861 [Mycena olivaceomarginata]